MPDHDSQQPYILKMNGDREPFDPKKLRASLAHAGAPEAAIESVVGEVEEKLRDGMTTREIYKRAYSILERIERPAAARYSLRKALQGFGPSGFPFEVFIGEIFKAKGYNVETGIMLDGKCVSHEVDMVATNEDEYIAMEIKFHNSQRIKSDMKVALYVKARFDDIFESESVREHVGNKKGQGWLLTNTKFTKNALKYAQCSGLTIVSWTYPGQGNLQDLIEETGLHPLTCLTTIPEREKTLLLNKGAVLCRDVKKDPDILGSVGLKNTEIDNVLEEANMLCKPTYKGSNSSSSPLEGETFMSQSTQS